MKKKIFLVKNSDKKIEKNFTLLLEKYFYVVDNVEEAELIIVLGGDGTILHANKNYYQYGKTFFCLGFGTINFLGSNPTEQVLYEIATKKVKLINVKLLEAELYDNDGKFINKVIAFNDFYFERSEEHSAKVEVTVNGTPEFDGKSASADAFLVCGPTGSTAYNATGGGIIRYLDQNGLVLTAIASALRHNFRTKLLPDDSVITLKPVETDRRPVSFVADGIRIGGVYKAVIKYSNITTKLGFAYSQDFHKKVRDYKKMLIKLKHDQLIAELDGHGHKIKQWIISFLNRIIRWLV